MSRFIHHEPSWPTLKWDSETLATPLVDIRDGSRDAAVAILERMNRDEPEMRDFLQQWQFFETI
ncbi:MAG TPA: hypothetical protein VHZ24_01820 [Pirellulales bacterium]|jgi:hypothetical protein|nr:hypothetical protein [Pirellulales bacterium]